MSTIKSHSSVQQIQFGLGMLEAVNLKLTFLQTMFRIISFRYGTLLEGVTQPYRRCCICCGSSHVLTVCIFQRNCCTVSMPYCQCPLCRKPLLSAIDYAFKLCGGIGLFFSFTEVRYCHLCISCLTFQRSHDFRDVKRLRSLLEVTSKVIKTPVLYEKYFFYYNLPCCVIFKLE